MQKETKSKKRNRKILNRTDNIQNQSDNQAKEVNSKCSRIRKKLRRTEKKQKYAPEAHPMILLCIRNAAERIFSRRNFIRKAQLAKIKKQIGKYEESLQIKFRIQIQDMNLGYEFRIRIYDTYFPIVSWVAGRDPKGSQSNLT